MSLQWRPFFNVRGHSVLLDEADVQVTQRRPLGADEKYYYKSGGTLDLGGAAEFQFFELLLVLTGQSLRILGWLGR